MGPWVHYQPLARNGSGFQRRILCPGTCHPPSPCLSLFRPRVGQSHRHPVCWPLWPRWPRWPRWPGAHREQGPWHHWHPCHRPHRWWRHVWWRFHPSRCRRRHLFRVQFPHLRFTASPWLHGLYGMQARIGETKNGFGKKLGSNEDRGTSPPTRPLIKFQSEWLWLWVLFVSVRDDFGFQRNDISLDVSGQVRKLHGCMTDSFHPMNRAPGTGMPLPCANFYLFLRHLWCWDVG